MTCCGCGRRGGRGGLGVWCRAGGGESGWRRAEEDVGVQKALGTDAAGDPGRVDARGIGWRALCREGAHAVGSGGGCDADDGDGRVELGREIPTALLDVGAQDLWWSNF